jgi:chromosome segregation ATPase
LIWIVQALDLLRPHAHKRAVEVAQGAHVVELEADNARLQVKFEQARQALADADAARSSLSASWEELEWECTGLHAAIDTLKQEKAQVVTDPEANVVA